MMRAKSAKDAFAIRGFQNWKLIATTCRVFRQHELHVGAFHKAAVERVIRLLEATTEISVAIAIAVSYRKFFL